MIPRDRLERLPIPVPALAGYLVDSEGQVWREGGAKSGKDRPLRPMRFVDAIRGWEQRGDLHSGARVVQLMPGVWQWCRRAKARRDGVEWNTWGHTDWVGFIMRYTGGGSESREKPWPEWTSAELDASGKCSKHAAQPSWFVIRTAELLGESLLVAGPVVFASIRARGSLTPRGADE